MSNCPASNQSGTGMNKNAGAREPVRYRDKRTQSGTGMLLYRTEIQDAGMPMPAASASLPMPSYDLFFIFLESRTCWRSVLRRRRQSRRPKYQRAIYFFFHFHLIGVGLTNVPRQQWSCRYGSSTVVSARQLNVALQQQQCDFRGSQLKRSHVTSLSIHRQ